MAVHNEILAGRYNRFLQKLFGLKGGPPAPQLSSEIMASIGLFSGVEHRYLESWMRYSNAPVPIVAVAGNNCEFRLRNDVGSNVIGVIEKLFIETTLADEIDICLQHQSALVSGHVPDLVVNPSITLDGRTTGPGGATLGGSTLVGSTSTATNLNTSVIGRFKLPANGTYDAIVHEDQQITVLPQEFFQVQTSAVTNTMLVTIFWRERALEEGELK